MLTRNVRTAVLGAVCALLPASSALAQGAFARALPADTMMYVSFPDIRASIGEMKDMPVARIWREAEVQDFFADALKLAHAQWDEMMAGARKAHEQGQLPFDPDELVKLRVTSASFAVTRMKLEMLEGARDPMPRIGVVAHLDFGSSTEIWRKVIDTGLQMMIAEAGDEVAVSKRDAGGAQLMSLRPTRMPEGFDMALNMAWVGDGVLIGTLTEDVESMLGHLASGESALTATPAWKQVHGKLGVQGAEAEFYFRPGYAFDFLVDSLRLAASEGELPPEVDIDGIERVIDALGLRGIDGIASVSEYVGGKSVSTTFVAAPKDRRKGFFADTTGSLDRKFLRWIPRDAVAFSASRFDIQKVYTTLTSALRAYDENLAEMMMGHLAEMEQQLGVSLENDLFGAFGDEVVSWSMPMAAFGTAPEMAILLEVRDQEGLLKTLDTVSAMSKGMFAIDKVERRGITVYQVRLDIDFGNEMGGMNPLAAFVPTFGFKDGYMVMAFSTGDVKRAFTRMEREDDPSGDIRSSEEFAPYLAQIPADASSLSFTDWKATFEGYYQLVTGLLAFVPLDEEIPFDLALLPDSQTLTQHLFGAVSWSQTTDDGIVATSISPFGPEVVVPLVGALCGGLLGATMVSSTRRGF